MNKPVSSVNNQGAVSNKQVIQGIEQSGKDVIKGGYQVVTPNPPPDPKPSGTWGTAVPTSTTPGQANNQAVDVNSSPVTQKDK